MRGRGRLFREEERQVAIQAIRRYRRDVLPFCALLLYLAGIGEFLLRRHQELFLELDPGCALQDIWIFQHHYPLFGTILGRPILGDHFPLLFMMLTPPVAGLEPFRALLGLHLAFCGLIGVFAYRLALRFLEPVAAVFCWAALLVGPLMVFFCLYPIGYLAMSLAAVFFLCDAVFAAGDCSPRLQRVQVGASLLIMATSYEPSLLAALGIGVFLFSQKETRRQGLVLSLLSLGLLALVLGVVLPHFRGNEPVVQASRYAYLLQGKLPPVLTRDPGLGLSTVTFMALGGGWLGCLQPALWLSFLPGTLANFLSEMKYTYSICLHYQMTVLPGIFVTMLWGVRKLAKTHRPAQRRWAALCLFLAVASWAGVWRLYEPFDTVRDPQDRELWREAMRQVPPGASVLVPARLASQMADRGGDLCRQSLRKNRRRRGGCRALPEPLTLRQSSAVPRPPRRLRGAAFWRRPQWER